MHCYGVRHELTAMMLGSRFNTCASVCRCHLEEEKWQAFELFEILWELLQDPVGCDCVICSLCISRTTVTSMLSIIR
eukprot:jgi/Picsp_1/6301/NSC_03650-R1_---NA---